jgi:hypothetical protein
MTLFLNVLQSAYALKHPRKPLSPSFASPAKGLRSTRDPFSQPSPARGLVSSDFKVRALAPSFGRHDINVIPQARSQKALSASTFAPSPISSPSRSLDYSVSSSVFDVSDTSILSQSSPSPSVSSAVPPASPLASYIGRRGVATGRERLSSLELCASSNKDNRSSGWLILARSKPS